MARRAMHLLIILMEVVRWVLKMRRVLWLVMISQEAGTAFILNLRNRDRLKFDDHHFFEATERGKFSILKLTSELWAEIQKKHF